MKSYIKKIIRSCIPFRVRRMVKNAPYLLPGEYRNRILHYERAALGAFEICSEAQMSRLRQCVHIVDKGLHREDWEPGHSVSHYGEAKILLQNLGLNEGITNSASYKWADEIIKEYEDRQREPDGIIPLHGELPVLKSCSDDLFRIIRARKSSRCLRAEMVSEITIRKIVEAANEAPSSCNRQTLRVYAANKGERSVEILKCFKGFSGFGKYVPCALVFCVDLRPYSYPNEIFIPTLDATLAVENAVLMATALGLSATLLSWGSRSNEEDRKLRSMLNIPDFCEIVVGAACGYPERESVRPARKSTYDTLYLN